MLVRIFILSWCFLAVTVAAQVATINTVQKAIDYDNTEKQKVLDLLLAPLESGEFEYSEVDQYLALKEVAFAYLRLGQIVQAREYTFKLRQFGVNTGNIFYQARSYNIEGEIYDALADFQKKLDAQKMALQLYDSIEGSYDRSEKVTTLVGIASAYHEMGILSEALNVANDAEKLANDIEDLDGVASAYNTFGNVHQKLGNYPKALEYLLKTIELDKQIGKVDEISTSLYNVASVYEEMGDLEMAQQYYQQALDIDLRTQNPDHLGFDYAKLGKMSLELGDVEEARIYTLKAMDMFQKVNATRNIAWMNNKLASIELAAGDFEATQEYLDKSLSLNPAGKDSHLFTEMQTIKARLALAQENFIVAHESLDLVEKNAVERRAAAQIEEIFELRSKIFERQGRFEQALESFRRFHELYENMNERARANAIAGLQSNINFLQKEYKIQMLEKDTVVQNAQLQQAKIERNAWVSILLSILFIIASIGYREFTKRRVAAFKAGLLEESVQRKNAMLAEVSHELRSPLTALQLQIESLEYNLEDDPAAAYARLNRKVSELNQLIEDLYQLARADNGLLKLDIEEVSVKDLVEEITEGYSEVVEHHGLKLETELSEATNDLVPADALRIKQVIVNLIRNSLNYTDSPGIIKCSTQIAPDKVEILLEDSAPSVSEPDLERLFERMYRADSSKQRDSSGSGLGLSICKSLIDAHKGTIEASQSSLGGLKINISLPKTEFNKAA